MKTKELKEEPMKKLTQTQQTLLDFVEKFDSSTIEVLEQHAGLNKLTLAKTLKALVEAGRIKKLETTPVRYEIVQKDSSTKETKNEVKETEDDEKKEDIKFNKGRDLSKFSFKGTTYSKSRLVQAVINAYVKDNPKTTFKQLQEIFKSEEIQKRYGVIVEVSKAKQYLKDGGRERHFIKDVIKLKDKKKEVVICNQWSAELLLPFLKIARSLKYTIKQV